MTFRRVPVLWQIARHEFRSLLKDGRLAISIALVAFPLALSLYTGYQEYRIIRAQNRRAQSAERNRWLNQGIKGPHVAMDQGIIVFQPLPVLSVFDSGVLPFTGTEEQLVGHHQQMFTSKIAEGASTLHRLGLLTPAVVLQVFAPLALVLLLYPAFAGEREQGTLRQLLAAGVTPRELFIGKLIGLALPVTVTLAVLALAAAAASLASARDDPTRDLFQRVVILSAAYLAYFAIVSGLALTVSVCSLTTRQSLAISIALWFGGCVFGPVLAMDLASVIVPSPTALSYATAEMDADRRLPTVEERRSELRKRLLAKYGVASLRELPVDPIGIELLEEAEQSEPIFHHLIAGVYDTHQRQNRLYQTAGILSPMIVIQQLSMTIAGTELSAHLDFVDAAEVYRRRMDRMMNEAIAYNPHYKESAVFPGTDIIISQGGPELWRQVPEFVYTPLPVRSLGPRLRNSCLLLLFWLTLACWLILRSTRHLKVD
jgi:ABC-2 type transport system permease protein